MRNSMPYALEKGFYFWYLCWYCEVGYNLGHILFDNWTVNVIATGFVVDKWNTGKLNKSNFYYQMTVKYLIVVNCNSFILSVGKIFKRHFKKNLLGTKWALKVTVSPRLTVHIPCVEYGVQPVNSKLTTLDGPQFLCSIMSARQVDNTTNNCIRMICFANIIPIFFGHWFENFQKSNPLLSINLTHISDQFIFFY